MSKPRTNRPVSVYTEKIEAIFFALRTLSTIEGIHPKASMQEAKRLRKELRAIKIPKYIKDSRSRHNIHAGRSHNVDL